MRTGVGGHWCSASGALVCVVAPVGHDELLLQFLWDCGGTPDGPIRQASLIEGASVPDTSKALARFRTIKDNVWRDSGHVYV
ncbi:MAG: hypothetical protein MI923_22865 [Phycisphaerales bacterium]|nr:hypothetical protein [Phycisphaerales bacterium]